MSVIKTELNFIDISSWQAGLDLVDLFGKNPDLDGVVVKATGGASFVQPTCDPWVQSLIKMAKPWGFYHFLDDDCQHSEPEKEAEFFVKNCKNYFGHGVPMIDYEEPAKSRGTGYLKRVLDRVYQLTGIKPLVYCSLSTIYEQDFSDIAKAGYKLWVAQYANMRFTGIQENPWQSGTVSPFDGYIMHQYSSCGRLMGYNANLDLNKFYGTLKDWEDLAKNNQNGSKKTEELKPPTPEIVMDVLNGLYGERRARTNNLKASGYDPKKVQDQINNLYVFASELTSIKKKAGKYFECVLKIAGVK